MRPVKDKGKEELSYESGSEDDDDNEDDDEEEGDNEEQVQDARRYAGASNFMDDEDDEDEPKFKVYHTATDLLRKTEESEARRKARGPKRKRKPPRVWSPGRDYEWVRDGIILAVDPESMLDKLDESHLTLFRHVDTDPPVRFAVDAKRPLWKGVFRMHGSMGYGPDQYYNPKKTQLKVLYAKRDKASQPADNTVVTRDGQRLPYWVDDWQWVKDSDRVHKQTSRMRKVTQKNVLVAATEAAPLMPISGWMQAYVGTKQARSQLVSPSGVLKPSPASALAGQGAMLIGQMRKSELVQPQLSEPSPPPSPIRPGAASTVMFSAFPSSTASAPTPVSQQAAPRTLPPPATSQGNGNRLRILKMQFLSQQHNAWTVGAMDEVVPQCADFWTGSHGCADPDELLTAFIKFAEKNQ